MLTTCRAINPKSVGRGPRPVHQGLKCSSVNSQAPFVSTAAHLRAHPNVKLYALAPQIATRRPIWCSVEVDVISSGKRASAMGTNYEHTVVLG